MANEDERVYYAKISATPEEVDRWLSFRIRGSKAFFDKLAEANKKQIPVKVDTTASCWRCPVCGMELHGTRYCPNCGQALDWGTVMTKLKPCPFCGCEISVAKYRDTLHKLVGKHDEGCVFFVMLWSGGFETQDEAVEAWNRRADNG